MAQQTRYPITLDERRLATPTQPPMTAGANGSLGAILRIR